MNPQLFSKTNPAAQGIGCRSPVRQFRMGIENASDMLPLWAYEFHWNGKETACCWEKVAIWDRYSVVTHLTLSSQKVLTV